MEEIAQVRDLSMTTIQNHIIKAGEEGEKVNWDDFIPADYEQLIIDAIKELCPDKLKPIKEMLPADVDYMAIKAVICKQR